MLCFKKKIHKQIHWISRQRLLFIYLAIVFQVKKRFRYNEPIKMTVVGGGGGAEFNYSPRVFWSRGRNPQRLSRRPIACLQGVALQINELSILPKTLR
jgi:hypothetical protein